MQLVVKGNAVIQILTNVPVVLTTWLNMALIYRLDPGHNLKLCFYTLLLI